MKKIAIISLFEQLVFSLISFISVVYLARFSDANNLAEYNNFMIYLTGGLMLMNSASVTPLNSLVKRLDERSLLLLSSLTAFLIAIFSAFLLIYFIGYNDILSAILVFSSCFTWVIRDFYRKVIFHNFQSRRALVFIAVAVIAYSSTIIFFYFDGAVTFKSILIAIILSSMIYLGPYIISLCKLICASASQRTWSNNYWEFIRFGLFQMLSAILLWTSLNSYLVHASTGLIPKENAALRAGISLGSIIGMLILSLENYIPKFFAKNTNNNKSVLKISLSIALIITSSLIFIAYILSDFIFTTIFGASYKPYSFVTIFIVLWQSICLFCFIFQSILRARNKVYIITISYFAMCTFALSFSNYLIKNFGLIGLLWGLIIGQILGVLVLLLGMFRWNVKIKE
ncbi:Uncharacterised protein [Serratia fonticola]|uniref:lipopolysaccharide biosynthesis protein n=1 Tax=Serratia fonticola TaxID=47917 RepID=UPI002178E9B6|nr:hypothetical protein [Serratia fonticola]CAI1767024.1 Uncharacterised protein [Serratia fonticola]